MKKKLVIFDLDGTLIDSRADLASAVNLMRADYGLAPLDLAMVTAFVGNGMKKLVERALKGVSVSVDEAVGRMRGHYKEHLVEQTQFYPGTVAALKTIKNAGYNLAIVTNKPEDETRQICRHFGIDELFGALLGGDSCENLKPHPEPLYLALRLTGSERDGAWMVGDNYTDLAAGRQAGMRRCYCRYGFGRLQGESFDLAVDSLGEFAEFLSGLNDKDWRA